MWPIRPEQITLRVCHDLDWRVSVRCPQCGYGVDVNLRPLASSKFGDASVSKLLQQGLFKCRRKKSSAGPACDGAPASHLDIRCMDVGRSRVVAAWAILSPGASPRLIECDLQQGGDPIASVRTLGAAPRSG